MHSLVALAVGSALMVAQPVPMDSVIWLPLVFDGLSGPYGRPSWSPNERQVAFEYFEYNPPQYHRTLLEVWSDDGTVNQCYIATYSFSGVAWSPIANEIAVTHPVPPGDCHGIRTFGLAGAHPSWSQDGERIAVGAYSSHPTCDRDTHGDVWTAASTGGDWRLVVNDGAQPDWSPDDRSIVFVRRGNLWTVGIDGTNEHQITDSGYDSWPAWSPDGRYVAFTRVADAPRCRADVWLVEATGGQSSRVSPIVEGQSRERPAWSKDGHRLMYFVLDATGSRLGIAIARNVIPVPVQTPTWSSVKRAYR